MKPVWSASGPAPLLLHRSFKIGTGYRNIRWTKPK
ncbi:hypothetical protein BSY18_4124 (plasmid) [Blastomonas sp. RAC04]|nr:hypothetical protein BSY18_4124 [Blastomonas sp. RAC04]